MVKQQEKQVSVYSLGLIETAGLTAAIEAADAAIKSADVHLMGYELAEKDGVITVKFEGRTGAVNIAVEAGCAAVTKMGEVYSHRIIPGIVEEQESSAEAVILTPDRVGSM